MAQRYIGIGYEVDWGVEVPPTLFLEAISESLQLEPNFLEVKTIRSNVNLDMALSLAPVRGSIVVMGNYQDMADLIYMLMGSALPPSGSDPFTHGFPAASGYGQLIGQTVEVQRDDPAADGAQTTRYAGCLCQSLSLSVSLEQPLQAELGFIGKAEAVGAAGTEAYHDFDLAIPTECTVQVDGADVDAESFSLEMNWPLDVPGKLGSSELAKKPIHEDVMAVTGQFVLLFDDMTQYDKFAAFATAKVTLLCSNGVDSLQLDVNKCKFTQATPHVDGQNRLKGTFAFSGFFDTTATEAVSAVVINSQPTVP